jgi:general stress protein YciG
MNNITELPKPKLQRGFAVMSREKHAAIARKGGKAAHAVGTAHEFTAEEARKAGAKGGASVSRDRAHMSRIGQLGGRASVASRSAAPVICRVESIGAAPDADWPKVDDVK